MLCLRELVPQRPPCRPSAARPADLIPCTPGGSPIPRAPGWVPVPSPAPRDLLAVGWAHSIPPQRSARTEQPAFQQWEPRSYRTMLESPSPSLALLPRWCFRVVANPSRLQAKAPWPAVAGLVVVAVVGPAGLLAFSSRKRAAQAPRSPFLPSPWLTSRTVESPTCIADPAEGPERGGYK